MKTLDIPLQMSLVLFMAGNLLDMGLLLSSRKPSAPSETCAS